MRRGDAAPLVGVLEHNRLDLVALAVFTARAAQLLEEGPESAATSREALGMGRLYARAGLIGEAIESFVRAARIGHDGAVTRAEALRAHAVLCRKLRRFDEAATSWRQALDARACPPAIAREASEALAIHHEHRAHDLAAARSFALDALRMQPTAERQRAVQHRLDLDRKIGSRRPTRRPRRWYSRRDPGEADWALADLLARRRGLLDRLCLAAFAAVTAVLLLRRLRAEPVESFDAAFVSISSCGP